MILDGDFWIFCLQPFEYIQGYQPFHVMRLEQS